MDNVTELYNHKRFCFCGVLYCLFKSDSNDIQTMLPLISALKGFLSMKISWYKSQSRNPKQPHWQKLSKGLHRTMKSLQFKVQAFQLRIRSMSHTQSSTGPEKFTMILLRRYFKQTKIEIRFKTLGFYFYESKNKHAQGRLVKKLAQKPKVPPKKKTQP